jgi:hypothetical protein
MPRRTRRKQSREAMRELRARWRKSGFAFVALWLPEHLKMRVRERSRQMKMFERWVYAAAIELGLRHLSGSDVQTIARRDHGNVQLPAAPRWTGAPCKPFDDPVRLAYAARGRATAIRNRRIQAALVKEKAS